MHAQRRANIVALAILGLWLPRQAMAQDLLVRIGHVGPVSGAQAPLGKDSELGAQLAVDELNARGISIGGKRVRFVLVPEDDAGDPKQGTSVAQKLVDAKVHGVVGHIHSGTSIPASRIYADAGIPQITPAAQHPKLTRQGFKTVFRIVPTSDDDLAAATSFAGRDGPALVLQGPANGAHERDIQTLRQTVDKAKARVLVYDGPLDDALRLALGEVKTIIATSCAAPSFSVAVTGYCVSDALPRTPELSAFEARFQSRFAMRPMSIAPYSYDAVNLMAAAMQQAGSAEPAKYLPALAKTAHFKGVTGTISFNGRGDLAHPLVHIFKLDKGGVSYYKSVQATEGTGGGCAESCKVCCSDKNGKYCSKSDRCER